MGTFVLNEVSMCLHIETESGLRCGKRLPLSCMFLLEIPSQSHRRCKDCFFVTLCRPFSKKMLKAFLLMFQAVSILFRSRFLLTVACTSTVCSSFRGAMALDSVAEFAIRIKYFGLFEYMDKFDAMGATTSGMFAFAANQSPNSVDDSAFIKEIIVPLLPLLREGPPGSAGPNGISDFVEGALWHCLYHNVQRGFANLT